MNILLTSKILEFIGVLVGFVTIFLMIVIYLKQRRVKSISYGIESLIPLLKVHDEVPGGIKILYDDQPVQAVHLVILEIFNSGNLPVLPTDYSSPISMKFGKNAKLLSYELIGTKPADLPAKIQVKDQQVILDPILLNPQDSIRVKVLLSEFRNGITVFGRIQGVKDIQRTTPSKARAQFRLFVLTDLKIIFVGMVVGAILYAFGQSLRLVGIAIMIAAPIAGAHELWKDFRNFKSLKVTK